MTGPDNPIPGRDEREPERRDRQPPPRRRTPPPRKRSAPSGRRLARRGGGIMSSLFGRQGLEEALEARLKSYTYESTRPTLRWLFIGLAVFIAAVLFLASSDQALRSAADEWAQEGITQIPPTPRELGTALFVAQATLNDGRTACHQSARDEDENLDRLCVAGGYQNVAGFAASGQLDCSGPEKILTILNPPAGSGCARLAEIVDRYESLTNRSSLALAIVIITFIAAAFPFSTFTHRSSRNLLTLKSERQGRSPDWAVISFFIPVLNLFRPLLIFIELFKASDPRVRVGDAEAWKKQGAAK